MEAVLSYQHWETNPSCFVGSREKEGFDFNVPKITQLEPKLVGWVNPSSKAIRPVTPVVNFNVFYHGSCLVLKSWGWVHKKVTGPSLSAICHRSPRWIATRRRSSNTEKEMKRGWSKSEESQFSLKVLQTERAEWCLVKKEHFIWNTGWICLWWRSSLKPGTK